MPKVKLEQIILLIPEKLDRWESNDPSLKRIAEKIFPNSEISFYVSNSPPKKFEYKNPYTYVIVIVLAGGKGEFFEFARRNINNKRVIIFTDCPDPGKSICSTAVNNPRVKKLSDRQRLYINYIEDSLSELAAMQ